MLKPRDENIPETWASTPGWFWTKAESRWRFRPESGRAAGPAGGGFALELGWVDMGITYPSHGRRIGGNPGGGPPGTSLGDEPGGFLGWVKLARSRLIERKLSPGVT